MNLEEFNRRLEENNANLIAVSDYMGRNNKIYVKCKKCNNLMGHKTVKSKFVCKFIFQLCGFIYATFIFKRFD